MSLILEALKKSEAERRLGQAPGLLDSSPYARRRRRSPWLLLASLGLLLAAVALAAFWLGQQEPRVQASPAPAAEPAAATPPEASSAPAAMPTAEPTLPPADRTPAAPKPASSPPLPADPGFTSVERESRPQPAQALPEPALAPTPIEMPAPPTQLAAPATSPAPMPPAATQTGGGSTAPAALEPAPPPLSSLGPERRGRLPPLKVSMHVYAEDPSQRVVLIDGRRLREGDSLGDGLRLLEIRRDGSVLELDGRPYLLPRS